MRTPAPLALILSVILIAPVARAVPSVGNAAAPAAPAVAADADVADELPGEQCTVDGLLADVKEGMRSGSPALRRYLKELLAEAALVLPPEVLRAELARTDDPGLIEALGAALAERALFDEDPSLVKDLLARVTGDEPAAVRAAALRALRALPSVELMEANGDAASYERLVNDEAPEVRQAVVENLLAEDAEVYSGHHAPFTEAALETALAAEDPAARARLLEGLSTETLGPDGARSLINTLDDKDPSVRAASARALGGLPPSSAGDARKALLEQFEDDEDLLVRRRVVESLVRLERRRAIPTLGALRRDDPRLAAEIDAWIHALSLGLHEWPLLVREKERRLRG